MARRLVPASAASRIGATWESFFAPAHKVIVRVPATTSNLGPGFDSMGFALNMQNTLIVERADQFSISVMGEGSDTSDSLIPTDESNTIVKSCARVMEMFGHDFGGKPPPFKFESRNTVPAQCGLGSSSSALVLGMAAGLALSGKEVYTPQAKKLLLQLAADEEGHADNISAAIYGGFQVNFKSPLSKGSSTNQYITQRVNVPPGLHCVLYIPDIPQLRDQARAVMPTGYSRDDTVHNIGRAAMLVNCFATGQFDALRFAMEDRVHQPYRSRFFPVEELIDAALNAGAHGAFLSSQGPTVVAICGGGTTDVGGDTMSQFLAEAVSDAMANTAQSRGYDGQVHVAMPSTDGLVSSGFSQDGTPLWGPEWEEAQKEKALVGVTSAGMLNVAD